MARNRVVAAQLTAVHPHREDDLCGVYLTFEPQRTRIVTTEIEDFASLGPEHCIPSVTGIGKVLRILRAARIATPAEPLEFLGRETWVGELLERAIGTEVRLEVAARNSLLFEAWTEEGVRRIENIRLVEEDANAIWVYRIGGGSPVRIARSSVIRSRTSSTAWWQVREVQGYD